MAREVLSKLKIDKKAPQWRFKAPQWRFFYLQKIINSV
jgi:hypothetical protein